MIVSHKYKFAYMPTPKTGCTSMINRLIIYLGAKIWTPFDDSTSSAHDCHLREDMKDYFVFATVRNPYHHAISFWKFFFSNKMSFEEFVEKRDHSIHKHLNQHEGYQPPPNCVKFQIHEHLKLECIQSEIRKLPFWPVSLNVPRLNIGRHFIPYISSDTLDLIKEKRELDFEMFGYSTDHPTDLMVAPEIPFQ